MAAGFGGDRNKMPSNESPGDRAILSQRRLRVHRLCDHLRAPARGSCWRDEQQRPLRFSNLWRPTTKPVASRLRASWPATRSF